jgi:hypothetical protein
MTRTRRWLLLSCPVAAVVAVATLLFLRKENPDHAPETDPPPWPTEPEVRWSAAFRDVTPSSDLRFTYRNGEEADHYSLLESLGGGVALLDYDGDGLLDIFLTGGGAFTGPGHNQIVGHPCKLFRNLGGWKFEDVTSRVGLDLPPERRFYSHGCVAFDYDNDGWPDLLVTGYNGLALFHNVPDGKGGRAFVETTIQAGLRPPAWATSAGWGDLDGDGRPELYVCQYVRWSLANHRTGDRSGKPDVPSPRLFEPLPDLLYLNRGGGAFRPAGPEIGLRPDSKALGVLFADINGDGRPDIYVANDTTDNFLYLNESEPGALRLCEVGLERGVARGWTGQPDGSMGVDAGDYDGSGRASLWVTNFETELPALYRNNGRAAFSFATQVSGISRIGRAFVGFGTGFLDVDNDGWEDLFISNGHVLRRHPGRKQRPVLLRNLGGRFVDVSRKEGDYFQRVHLGRGVAVGDLDNDGRPDLVVSHLNEPITLLRNECGAGAHWLGIALRGAKDRDVVGARLTLEVAGRRRTRFAKGGGSYLSSGDPRLLFGLGKGKRTGRLTVVWPSGQPRTQHWEDLAIDRYWVLRQGEATAIPWPGARP